MARAVGAPTVLLEGRLQCPYVVGVLDLRQQHRVRSAARRRRHVVAAPFRLQPVDAHHDLALRRPV
jgi:hypothetical protein